MSEPKEYDVMFGWSMDRAMEIRKNSKPSFSFWRPYTVKHVIKDAKKIIAAAQEHVINDETVQ